MLGYRLWRSEFGHGARRYKSIQEDGRQEEARLHESGQFRAAESQLWPHTEGVQEEHRAEQTQRHGLSQDEPHVDERQ